MIRWLRFLLMTPGAVTILPDPDPHAVVPPWGRGRPTKPARIVR